MATFPCPKCGRTLQQSGELSIGPAVFPSYQCDECIVPTDIGGETMDLALTFVVGADGQPFDPATPDGRLPI